MVFLYNFMDIFKLYFVHFFWLGVLFTFVYSFYYDFVKIKKRNEYMSDSELLERFIQAKRKNLIK